MDEATPERWLPVVGYEGLYWVSDYGRVRTKRRQGSSGGLKKAALNSGGYLYVNLCQDSISTRTAVHQIVAKAFLGARPEGPDGEHIRHLDDNKLNNAASNLAYGSVSANVFDRVTNGIHFFANKTHCPKGHPYDAANTRLYQGRRNCRACDRERGGKTKRAARKLLMAS